MHDMANEQVYEEDYNMSSAKGSHYSVFCHGGGFMIDDMQVYLCASIAPLWKRLS